MFHDEVWHRMGMGKRDVLCTGCARGRLGRTIHDSDLIDYLSSATIIKTETVVTAIAEKPTDGTYPCIVVTIWCMSRPNPIRTLARVVSGVALPYNPPQPRPLRTGLAARGGEEQEHAAE
jgi:hypothetical protein